MTSLNPGKLKLGKRFEIVLWVVLAVIVIFWVVTILHILSDKGVQGRLAARLSQYTKPVAKSVSLDDLVNQDRQCMLQDMTSLQRAAGSLGSITYADGSPMSRSALCMQARLGDNGLDYSRVYTSDRVLLCDGIAGFSDLDFEACLAHGPTMTPTEATATPLRVWHSPDTIPPTSSGPYVPDTSYLGRTATPNWETYTPSPTYIEPPTITSIPVTFRPSPTAVILGKPKSTEIAATPTSAN